ncbi:hypothetical protein HN51_004248 [Arachis hypogaea]|uniref:Transmembrane protein n=2 Tax=Arachis TaxID=3817 RepID=A0A444WP89_ARAHY|nr:uncharacterized protein LOC107483408 [Arachis duranensis]XP_025694480.1 uncharacterized protein LOC112796314 [Arachis hypogaea]XP_057754220.1 uncharacterized protein LOC130973616 [Arachis stenosperma]RYQ79339.1 hypothetical protein Ahy_Scaffold6g108066 isoform A [Arachis hypogaea]
MDHVNAKDNENEVDLESGLPLLRDDESKNISPPSTSNQGKKIFAKIPDRFVGGSLRGEEMPSFPFNESTLSQVSLDLPKVANKPMMGQDLADAERTPLKEKRKKSSHKKPPRPPRPPKAPELNAADYKLIREITELAMLKRARIERMKALKKMKAAKQSSPSSSNTSILAMIFTLVFCIVLIFHGISSGKGSGATFQGSPLSTAGEGGLISVQFQLTPYAVESKAPGSQSSFVQQVTGSDLAEKLKRN